MKKFKEAWRSEGVPKTIGKLAIVTFVLGVWMSVFATFSAFNVRTEIKDAFEVVGRLRREQGNERDLLRRIVDAETALRGYALTGEEQYLEPYVEARDTFAATKARYHAARGPEGARYARFDQTLDSCWLEIERAIAQLRREWPDIAGVKPQIAAIKETVDRLRDEQAELDTELSAKLDARRARANDTVGTLLTALSILAIGLMLLSFAQLREMAIQAARYLRSERKAADEISGLENAVALSQAELAWVNRQLAITLRSAGVQVFTLDKEGRIGWVADAHSRIAALNHAPLNLVDSVPQPERPVLREALGAVFALGEERDIEVPLVSTAHDTRWVRLHLAPQGEGDADVVMGCAFDITDLKTREENNFWLMRELSHRSKNLLAIVQSIVRQTARNASDKEAFLTRFSARLQALAASHDLLVKTDYAGADLAALIRSQLSGVDHLVGSRILLSGPPLVIRAEAAQNLGMALHELASNAMVHGALRAGEGRVDITWQIGPGEKEPELQLDWVESGHGAPASRHGPGFGDMLIRVNLPRSLEGTVSLDHRAEGTHCTMRLPIRRLKPDFQGLT